MKTNYPQVNCDEAARQLVYGVLLQSVKDYFGKKANPQKRGKILKFLESNGELGITIANELRNNPDKIAERLGRENSEKETEEGCPEG